MDENRKKSVNEVTGGDAMHGLIDVVKYGVKIFSSIAQYVRALRPEPIELLTYAHVIEELIKCKPKDSLVVKGAALKKVLPSGKFEITILYLDKKNEPVWGDDPDNPYGCKKIARHLDDELIEMFGEDDLIIFE